MATNAFTKTGLQPNTEHSLVFEKNITLIKIASHKKCSKMLFQLVCAVKKRSDVSHVRVLL